MHARSLGPTVAVLLILGLAGCDAGEMPEIAETPEIPPATEVTIPGIDRDTPAGTTVRVADIVGNPAAYDGREVVIEAEVDEVLGPRAFKLDEDAPLAGGVDNDLVVLYPRSASLADLDDQWLNDRVRVTGTIRTASVVDIEREVGWDLDPQIEIEIEGLQAVLVARSVERISGAL